MGLFSSHATSDVTNIVNNIVEGAKNDQDPLIEGSIPELLDAISKQNDLGEPGPVEAARAIRKQLKYGSDRQQLNALKLLELLVSYGGDGKMTLLYNDRKLIKYLIFIASGVLDEMQINHEFRSKAIRLAEEFKDMYENDEARKSLAEIYDKCGLTRGGRRFIRSRKSDAVPDFMDDKPDGSVFSDAVGYGVVKPKKSTLTDEKSKTNKELDRKYRIPHIDDTKEAPRIEASVDDATELARKLQTALDNLSPEQLSIHSDEANILFDDVRTARRKILRYIQLVQTDALLVDLLQANDSLINALERYSNLAEPQGKQTADQASVAADNDQDSLLYYETDDSLDDGLQERFNKADAWSSKKDSKAAAAPATAAAAAAAPAAPADAAPAVAAAPAAPAAATTTADSANPFDDAAKSDKPTEWK